GVQRSAHLAPAWPGAPDGGPGRTEQPFASRSSRFRFARPLPVARDPHRSRRTAEELRPSRSSRASPPQRGGPFMHERDLLFRPPSRWLSPSRASPRLFRAHHARELDAPHLSASRERQRIKETNLVRDLVVREHAPAPLLDLLPGDDRAL